MIIFYILFVLCSVYVAFLLFILAGTFYTISKNIPVKKKYFISVIIAARNEEKHLVGLLDALIQQDYPKDLYEIIVINDRSEDQTDNILNNYSSKYSQIKYYKIEDVIPEFVGKKRALTEGIRVAKGDVLLFTDADCRPRPGWMRAMNDAFWYRYDVIVGYSPLLTTKTSFGKKIVHLLKKLERLAMFTFSAGSIGWNWGITATGRNFAYRKSVFKDMEGFEGIGFIPSGDDDLFLQKISRTKKYRLGFISSKESIVPSIEDKTSSECFHQEKRRGSKFRFYPLSIKLISFMTFIFLVFLVFAFVLCLIGLVPWKYFLVPFLIKSCADLLLLLRGAVLFKEFLILLLFPFVEVLYAPYFIVFGLLGSLSGYRWKQ
ncbi:MAG TPA: glycosyltransferase [Candidatus Cloacimonetes bacterium]|nr:glycosyltransferase [Candidatus Cloacimonadota bacterium]HEX38155.1 glycosyltransferase [Candidatus Cloacimonadota bacterium]